MKMAIDMTEPAAVALSAPGESEWGVHQFPCLTRLPGASILLTYADAADMSETHGGRAPAFVSDDDGATWAPYAGALVPIRPHFSISEVFDGEYLVMPSCRYLDVSESKIALPEPIGEADAYGKFYTYRLADLPPAAQAFFCRIPGRRWDPESKAWKEDRVELDPADMLVWKRADSNVLPRTYFEHHLLKVGRELLLADYRVRYLLPPAALDAGAGGLVDWGHE